MSARTSLTVRCRVPDPSGMSTAPLEAGSTPRAVTSPVPHVQDVNDACAMKTVNRSRSAAWRRCRMDTGNASSSGASGHRSGRVVSDFIAFVTSSSQASATSMDAVLARWRYCDSRSSIARDSITTLYRLDPPHVGRPSRCFARIASTASSSGCPSSRSLDASPSLMPAIASARSRRSRSDW